MDELTCFFVNFVYLVSVYPPEVYHPVWSRKRIVECRIFFLLELVEANAFSQPYKCAIALGYPFHG